MDIADMYHVRRSLLYMQVRSVYSDLKLTSKRFNNAT